MKEFSCSRPEFPKRAVITSGMPYGNKTLHYGHVGMTVRADIFARFMRDRIGAENVVFVSGTDCYGSPAVESYRQLVEKGNAPKTIVDYVKCNHLKQKEIFDKYEINFNLFGASAFGRASEIHVDVSDYFLRGLNKAGMVSIGSSYQFYDKKYKCLINGRQVVGKCPVEGCASEHGYADECSLGHQYLPRDLINPISNLSGEKPELIKVENLYFDLDKCTPLLTEWIASIERESDTPQFMVKEIKEFFKKPEVYIKREFFAEYENIKKLLPKHTELERNEKAQSLTIVFETLAEREKACEMLAKNNIRYRTGKTLTPFRLTGNIEWGVPCPEFKGIKGQTFYVWPESLWAPITFTKTYLESIGKTNDEWKKYWCSKNAQVYQFLGEDNLYFYGPAQQAMFLSMQGEKASVAPKEGELQPTKICPIKSILYMNQKASSSGAIKPPSAEEFLNYYTSEQFRIHFMAMNLANNNVSLFANAFDANAKPEDKDPFTAEGNLLTNVYNRALRTVFYTTQNNFGGVIPKAEISEETFETCKKAILNVERFMHDKKFHQVYNEIDVFVRNINKYWTREIAKATSKELLAALIANAIQMLYVANILLHPVAPTSTENVAKYFGFALNKCFSWNNIFGAFYEVLDKEKKGKIIELKEKEDFFKRHPYQIELMYGNK